MRKLHPARVRAIARRAVAYLLILFFLFVGIAFGKPYTDKAAPAPPDRQAVWIAYPPSDPPPTTTPQIPNPPGPVPEPNPAPPSPPAASERPQTGSCDGDWDCFRECTIDHESRSAGMYTAVSGDGIYRGAFQYLASTWQVVATNAGYAEWAHTPVDQVPPEIQDAVAQFHYELSGNRPWGGRC